MAFNDRLKEARELIGFSRQDLAEKLGVTSSAISNYENGVSSPKEEIMLKIFNVLSVEPNYLFQDSFVKSEITNNEIEIIKKYRLLDERGKKNIIDTLEREIQYIQKDCPENEQSDEVEDFLLEFAGKSQKEILDEIVRRQEERGGIAAFGGESISIAPLTDEEEAEIIKFLKEYEG